MVFLGALKGSISCSLFLIYIKSYSPLLNSLQPIIYFFSLLYAKTLAGKLNPDLKANLNGQILKAKSEIRPYVIQFRSKLRSKSYIFIEKDKIISVTKLFQHLLSAEILSEWKFKFKLPYLVRYFKINARNKLTTKCLLKSSHYTRPHLEYGS